MTTQYYNAPQTDGNPGGSAAMPTSNDVSQWTNNVLKNAPIVNTDITSAAMHASFSLSQWMGRRGDKKASAEITASNHAETGTASVRKNLLGNCPELVAVHKYTGLVRNLHTSLTMPWGDDGMRLLPTAQYFKYHQTMTAAEAEFWGLVNAFTGVYEWRKSTAQARLGGLYNPADYPTLPELERKFRFQLSYTPIPKSGDFRVDIGNEATAEIKASCDEYYERNIANAMNDVWTRLHKVLIRMSTQLSYKADGSTEKFKDTLVGNVSDMVELLGVCNITGDSQMTAMKDRLSDAMYGITPEVLREDTFTRDETKQNIDRIIAALPSLDV